MKEKLTKWMKSRRGSTHITRLVVGGYIAYLGFKVIKHISETPKNTALLYILSILFIIIGAAIAVLSLYAVCYGYTLEQSGNDNIEESAALPDDENETESGEE